jgi:methylmalonyl-CoA mutase
MIDDLLSRCDFETVAPPLDGLVERLDPRDPKTIARLITLAENHPEVSDALAAQVSARAGGRRVPVLGVTGTGGSGKSSLVDEIVRRFLGEFADRTVAVISVDPSKRRTGGALLGDRIRMNSIHDPRVYMRSLATRQANLALSRHVQEAVAIVKAAGFDLVVVETSGIGQSDTEIVEHADVSLYVMTAEYGAATQLEKIDMLDFADVVAINKFDKRGSLDALRDVRKQFRRNRRLVEAADDALPVFGTIASQFNDPGANRLYRHLMDAIAEKTGASFRSAYEPPKTPRHASVIPPERVRYLAEITETADRRRLWVEEQVAIARRLGQVRGAIAALTERAAAPSIEVETRGDVVRAVRREGSAAELPALRALAEELESKLDAECRTLLDEWPETKRRYAADKYRFEVRERVVEQDLHARTLSGLRVPRIALPRSEDPGEILRFLLTENVPGFPPYTAGVFPLKRTDEEAPTRMFAGEGGPERTNRRFHYVSRDMPAKRLSTAFDSVTLYGEDPARRPDIYGKIGNSGVSVATVDDAKRLYSGFDLCDPRTSVSMTINGPAPMVLGFFLNAAVDQQCEKWLRAQGAADDAEARVEEIYRAKGAERPRYRGELPPGNDGLGLLLLGVSGEDVLPREVYERLRADALTKVRGTVQADILKEDQAQNTCIFSTEFALRLMGDVQAYFIDHNVRNFYSVSISGYHIAEAGANPVTQLAFTLANGFTYVEYYLSRGMNIDDFAPNLSFFFSNGVDAEYSVIGRVARRIWATAIEHRYGGNERSQKLKYHIQTSGRSLHAQEIAFNDIRTTLQALYAIFDHCNSLHTNAYDEAITTPTEESVRRAVAIQLIINKELGLARNENPLQGSYVVEELTDLVERAVLDEFRSLSERGGVLGAMERMYQRSKIQEESLQYESLKHSGELPIVGVNTFLNAEGSPTVLPREVIRSSPEEKEAAIAAIAAFRARHEGRSGEALRALQRAAVDEANTFEALMEACKVCTLGQLSRALYEVGGQYRRNM